MTVKDRLLREEEEAWEEFRAVAESLSPQQLAEDGYYADWSAKDLLAHVGSWLAEAVKVLEQIRMDTYSRWRGDVDELNAAWREAWRDVDVSAVKAHLHSGRGRMLQEWELLPEELVSRRAREWFRESGARHYREHLPRLREWAAELAGRRI
jgi:Mycothiol maleylpyruvate isomerase N-terminal domain